jgi:hypothetical protein
VCAWSFLRRARCGDCLPIDGERLARFQRDVSRMSKQSSKITDKEIEDALTAVLGDGEVNERDIEHGDEI